jgi:hypothetical protein
MEEANIYERVVACWLQENHIPFVDVDQSKRFCPDQQGVKNFDFLIRPESASPVLVEVKGRTCRSESLAGLKGLDGWVTFEDVQALAYWQGCFQMKKPAARAVFVFVFALEQIDIETDGQAVYDFGGGRYLLLAVTLQDYRACMKPRSPRWQTVTVAAGDFRKHAVPVRDVFFYRRWHS